MRHAPARRRLVPPRRHLLIAAAVIAALGMTSCSAPATSPEGEAAARDAGSTGSFTARTLDGKRVTVPGSRPSAVLFFSVECGGCGPTATALATAQRSVGDKVNFAAVDIAGETDEDIRGFLTDNRATTLAYAIDSGARLLGSFRVAQNSTVLVLDATGREVFRAVEPSAERIRAELAKVGA